jgi:hypothetical protein
VGDRQSTTALPLPLPLKSQSSVAEEEEAVEEDQLHFRPARLKMSARQRAGGNHYEQHYRRN